jgi:hypothetical protein
VVFAPRAGHAGEAEVGIAVGPLLGVHEEPGEISHVPPLPIPIVDASYRNGPVALASEGFPFALPIQSTNAVQSLDTHLGFFDVMARGYVDRAVHVAVGELVYNQRTLYVPPGNADISRVAGVRYEVGVDVLPHHALHASFDIAPNLWGRFAVVAPDGAVATASERGSQTEFRLWYEHQLGHGSLSYGVWYVDYGARFIDGETADRNAGAIPFVRYAIRFGRL